MFITSQIDASPFEWVLHYLPTIGWPPLLLIAWKASKFLVKLEDRALLAEKSIQVVADSNNELKDTLIGQVNAQKDLADSVQHLAEAMHHQSEMHAEQLSLIREVVAEQKVLSTNQTVMMNGLQRVIEQLVDAVSKG